MAELENRPEVRTLELTLDVPDETDRDREGANLDDVLRAVIFDLRAAYGWGSTAETARHLGLKQQTLAQFMDEKQPGTRLETLSRVCTAMRMSPVDIFQLHERYNPASRQGSPFAEDLIFNRFRAVLDVGKARKLLRVLEALRSRSLLDDAIALLERLVTDGKPEHRRDHAGKRKSNHNHG